jgi:hypothetical protein
MSASKTFSEAFSDILQANAKHVNEEQHKESPLPGDIRANRGLNSGY